MKKFLIFLLIFMMLFGVYTLYNNFKIGDIKKLDVEEEVINIDQLFIYGNHLNLHGNLVNDNNLELVLYNGEFRTFEINNATSGFNLGDRVNEGIVLDEIPRGKYYMFLRSNSSDDKGNKNYKYYILNNTTKYKETKYYTFSNIGNKIIINSDDIYKTLTLNITNNNDTEIYDVVVDPGHGGMDSGASKNGNKEADFTMRLALNLKEKLESFGVLVKLTREENQLSLNETLPNYGVHGRAVIPYEVNAKYVFSIHLNSSNYSSANGIEIYTADKINYDFAKKLAKNIKENANVNYSKNPVNKVFDGIYTRNFTESDIKSSLNDYKKRNMNAYDITTNSNYYYMIRETGGIITGAYVDNRNEEIGENPYFNSNVGCEAYLLELGYLTNKSDIQNINKNLNSYTEAIATSFKEIFVK